LHAPNALPNLLSVIAWMQKGGMLISGPTWHMNYHTKALHLDVSLQPANSMLPTLSLFPSWTPLAPHPDQKYPPLLTCLWPWTCGMHTSGISV
jgi:hypothetical protein